MTFFSKEQHRHVNGAVGQRGDDCCDALSYESRARGQRVLVECLGGSSQTLWWQAAKFERRRQQLQRHGKSEHCRPVFIIIVAS